MKYGIILDKGKYEGCIARFYKAESEVFKNGRWEDFWILSRGVDDPYQIKPITEAEAEARLGRKLHVGEEKMIHIADEAERTIRSAFGLTGLIEEAKSAIQQED